MSYKLSAKQGSLLNEQNATFMVNTSNTKLILGSGVSLAFRYSCGIKLQKEMTAALNRLEFILKKGDIVATSSGDSKNFKYALHIATMDYGSDLKDEDRLPTYKDVYNALKNIESYLLWYYTKNQNSDMKIVMPLIGCGMGKLDKMVILGLYKSFFLREVPFQCEVVVYGYSEEDYKMLNSVLL